MSTLRTPVGPQPPSVYWRRRLMVALGLIAVIVVIVLIVVRPGAGEPSGAADPSAEPTAEESIEPSTEPEEGVADDGMCLDRNLALEAVVSKESFAGGELPQIGLRVTNLGTKPCTLDVTPSRQVFTIGSAAEEYWVSSDCQSESEAAAVELQPNTPLSTDPLVQWDRTRSLPCDNSTAQVPAGDATYWLQVSLGELESQRVTFRLL